MAEVLDLRQFRCSQLEALLAAESAEWSRRLDWDYRSSVELIRQYIEARVLPGFVLVERSLGRVQLQGYSFFIYEGRKGMVGNLFVHPDHRGPGHASESRLLAHILETLRNSPGLERIEAQLMSFDPSALGESFARQGFAAFRRLFLELDLRALPPTPAHPDEVTHHRGLRLEPWGGASFDEAARLILRAYQGHVDARINDQYRTFSGALRFLHNIAHYPGCGTFDPAASLIARSPLQATLEGMVLVSRVKPDVAHLTQVCVLPQGQRQGLGRALVTRCLATLRRLGLRAASLTVTAENHSARKLYDQIGFQPRSEFDAYVWDHSNPQAPEDP